MLKFVMREEFHVVGLCNCGKKHEVPIPLEDKPTSGLPARGMPCSVVCDCGELHRMCMVTGPLIATSEPAPVVIAEPKSIFGMYGKAFTLTKSEFIIYSYGTETRRVSLSEIIAVELKGIGKAAPLGIGNSLFMFTITLVNGQEHTISTVNEDTDREWRAIQYLQENTKHQYSRRPSDIVKELLKFPYVDLTGTEATISHLSQIMRPDETTKGIAIAVYSALKYLLVVTEYRVIAVASPKMTIMPRGKGQVFTTNLNEVKQVEMAANAPSLARLIELYSVQVEGLKKTDRLELENGGCSIWFSMTTGERKVLSGINKEHVRPFFNTVMEVWESLAENQEPGRQDVVLSPSLLYVVYNDCIAKHSPVMLELGDYALSIDLQASKAVASIPLLPQAVQLIIDKWTRPMERARLLGDAVHLSQQQYQWIYVIAEEAARTMGVKVPEIFVKYDPTFNAYTLGTNEDHIIVIHSSLVDSFTVQELAFVICHEMGHIRSGHVTYLTIARILELGTFGVLGMLASPLKLAIEAWAREGEFTADRAGLLIADDIGAAISAMLMFAVGSRKLVSEINLKSYMEQGQGLNDIYAKINLWFGGKTHPYIVNRVAHIVDFVSSEEGQKVAGLVRAVRDTPSAMALRLLPEHKDEVYEHPTLPNVKEETNVEEDVVRAGVLKAKLGRLADLRDQGILTEEEYKRKRSDLIDKWDV